MPDYKLTHSKSIFSRFKLLIYPKFQLSLIAVNVLVTAIIFAFVTIQMNRMLGKLLVMGESAQIPKDHIYFQFIHWQMKEIYSYLGIAFGFGIIASSVMTLYISFKLVGPVMRLQSYFKKIEDTGEVTKDLSFRKNDFFTALPTAINGALKRLVKAKKNNNAA